MARPIKIVDAPISAAFLRAEVTTLVATIEDDTAKRTADGDQHATTLAAPRLMLLRQFLTELPVPAVTDDDAIGE